MECDIQGIKTLICNRQNAMEALNILLKRNDITETDKDKPVIIMNNDGDVKAYIRYGDVTAFVVNNNGHSQTLFFNKEKENIFNIQNEHMDKPEFSFDDLIQKTIQSVFKENMKEDVEDAFRKEYDCELPYNPDTHMMIQRKDGYTVININTLEYENDIGPYLIKKEDNDYVRLYEKESAYGRGIIKTSLKYWLHDELPEQTVKM